MKRLKLLAVVGLSLLALSACKMNKNEAAKDPVTAATDLAASVRANDFDRLSHIMVPPDLYAKLEARYKDEAAKKPAPTAEDEAQFKANFIDKYTAPGAEDKLFAQLQPQLAQMGPQIPMGVAMMSGMAGQSIDQNAKMSPAEKTQAKAVLTAITKWASTAPLADPEKAKQAIKVVCDAARDLKLTTLAAAQKLSFSEMAQKAGVAVGGLRKALAVYGFDTDKMLDSVKAVKKSGDDNNAVVTLSYTLLDTPVSVDVNMVQRDGRWYSADLIKSVEDSLANKPAEVAPPMSAPPAMQPGSDAQPAEGETPASSDQPSDAQSAPADGASSPASDASNGGG